MRLPRDAYRRLIGKRLRDNPVVALPGPRQAGKTTLARMFAEQEAGDEEVHFFDLESPADLARLAPRIWRGWPIRSWPWSRCAGW